MTQESLYHAVPLGDVVRWFARGFTSGDADGKVAYADHWVDTTKGVVIFRLTVTRPEPAAP